MDILVDTSVWIDYFRSAKHSQDLEGLIDENRLAINDIILAELVPYLQLKRQRQIIQLLYQLNRLPLAIDWQELIGYQLTCLKNGVNGVGIPDLMIAQNALQNHCRVYSLDKHFQRLNEHIKVALY